jgi:hypothetical protein
MEPLLTTVCAPLFRAIETDAGAPRESCKALAEEVVEVVTPPPSRTNWTRLVRSSRTN